MLGFTLLNPNSISLSTLSQNSCDALKWYLGNNAYLAGYFCASAFMYVFNTIYINMCAD